MAVNQESMSDLLLPEYRRRILGLLLLHPDESLHGREIARRTGLQQGTVARELRRMATVGFLTQQRRGNQTLYSADRTCPIYEELAGILRKTSGLADVLRDALAPVAVRVRVAFVFGSLARGSGSAGSDVDVLIVGSAGFADIVEALYPAQAALGREINPRVYDPLEFASKTGEPFLHDVLTKPKLFLIGNDDELAELTRQVA